MTTFLKKAEDNIAGAIFGGIAGVLVASKAGITHKAYLAGIAVVSAFIGAEIQNKFAPNSKITDK
jgi:uncharacterized protein YcfJ